MGSRTHPWLYSVTRFAGSLQRRLNSRASRDRHATSSNAFGLRSAIKSSVRAAPDGARRPCSQSCSVRIDTPSNVAKRSCESPVFSRTLATLGRFTTRPWQPLLISRSPASTSRPIFLLLFVISEKLLKLFYRQSSISGNTAHGKSVDGIITWNSDDPNAVRHDDVFALANDAESSFL